MRLQARRPGLAGTLLRLLSLSLSFSIPAFPQTHPPPEKDRILLVINENSPRSRRLGDFYQRFHQLQDSQVCRLHTRDAATRETENVSRQQFREQIEKPIADCLRRARSIDSTWYLVLTHGIPLRIQAAAVPDWRNTEGASVDSELTLLYSTLRGQHHKLAGTIANPFFEMRHTPFGHPEFPIYLVTRLAGYSFEDARRAVVRCRGARNTGRVVLDLRDAAREPGNNWLRRTATLSPPGRVVLDESTRVLSGIEDVIAYASWGSNDPRRKSRKSGLGWLPGAIAAEYVSTSARTLTMPPRDWTLGHWNDSRTWFAGAPQSMILDYVWEGVSGISGAIDEPYLGALPRPDLLIPAYLQGRNLAESFYLALPSLSWQVIIIGDPLCRLN
jgi:uncharacterized protein (TIGR03790 family)